MYYKVHNEPYIVAAGSLGFSIMIFSIFSVVAICILMVRRKMVRTAAATHPCAAVAGQLCHPRRASDEVWRPSTPRRKLLSGPYSPHLPTLHSSPRLSQGGELGGATAQGQWTTFGLFISLWLLSLVLTGLVDYGHIHPSGI